VRTNASGCHVWMPDYRRFFIPGSTYFFTVKTELNAPVFGKLAAMVLLPDHLHAIWLLPPSVRTADPTWLTGRC